MATRNRAYGGSRAVDEFHDDTEAMKEACSSFLRSALDHAGVYEVVVPLYGDVASTTTAALAADALGERSVSGLVLPAAASDDEAVDDAQRAAFDLGIDFRTVDIEPVVEALTEATSEEYWLQQALGAPALERHAHERHHEAVAEATERVRMAATYVEATHTDALVLGSGTRTALSLGQLTKYGDGAADLLPLGDLYATEVRRLADHLGVPERVMEAPARDRCDVPADGLDASREVVDAVLRKLLDDGRSIGRIATELGVDEALVVRLAEAYRDAAHKRTTPPTPATYGKST